MTPKPLIILMLCMMLMVSPALAAYEITAEPLGITTNTPGGQFSDYTIDVSQDGDGIQRISFDLSSGTTINFTLTYGDGSTVDGWFEYTNDGFYTQHTEVAIGGSASGYNYIGLQEIGRIDIVGYARNTTPDPDVLGIIVYDSVFGISEQKAVAFHPTTGAGDGVIYKIHFTSSQPVSFAWWTNDRSLVAKAANTSLLDAINEWIALVSAWKDTIIGVGTSTFYWLNFLFVENLTLIIALYISGSLAFAARSCNGNPIRLLRTFLKDQRNLFEFILKLWESLVNLIAQFRSIFRI